MMHTLLFYLNNVLVTLITREDLSCLPYITMCIKESLRLHCPVPIIQRLVTKDTQIDGHTIPANTMLEINLYLLHHNPDIWENPYVSQIIVELRASRK